MSSGSRDHICVCTTWPNRPSWLADRRRGWESSTCCDVTAISGCAKRECAQAVFVNKTSVDYGAGEQPVITANDSILIWSGYRVRWNIRGRPPGDVFSFLARQLNCGRRNQIREKKWKLFGKANSCHRFKTCRSPDIRFVYKSTIFYVGWGVPALEPLLGAQCSPDS